jgi:hypothetical protein
MYIERNASNISSELFDNQKPESSLMNRPGALTHLLRRTGPLSPNCPTKCSGSLQQLLLVRVESVNDLQSLATTVS